jgi:apolipoprotein N-acyltransferase
MDKGIHALSLIVFLYLIIFLISFFFKNKILALVLNLLVFELLIEYLPISYPGIITGNVMANQPSLIYWYSELTVYAGSIWILLTAYFYNMKRSYKSVMISLGAAFMISVIICNFNSNLKSGINIIAINTEHRDEQSQDKYIFNIVDRLKNVENASILIFPEQTLRGIDKNKFKSSLINSYFSDLLNNTSIKTVIVGSTYFERGQYLANGSITISQNHVTFNSKNKLVFLSEYVPSFLSFLSDKKSFSKNLPSELSSNLDSTYSKFVCYEAFFSLYTINRIKKENKLAILLASEQFLNSSYFGLRQYNNIVKLRAIENEISFLKVSSFANSIHIDSKGRINNQSKNEIQLFKL